MSALFEHTNIELELKLGGIPIAGQQEFTYSEKAWWSETLTPEIEWLNPRGPYAPEFIEHVVICG